MGGLRPKIFALVGACILLCVAGSTLSLFRITEVHRAMGFVTGVAVPVGRVLAQLEFDAELYRQEAERRLDRANWPDPRWKARTLPRWVDELVASELRTLRNLIERPEWADRVRGAGADVKLREWIDGLDAEFTAVKHAEAELVQALGTRAAGSPPDDRYTAWRERLEAWRRRIHWGAAEVDRTLRARFGKTQEQVSGVRVGLEVILGVVVALSLLLLWLGERALRPLGELTRLARGIADRGLRREDKLPLQRIPLSRTDEVSTLAREFRNMATALLEREKTVETQKTTLEEQNRQLREMSRLQERLRSAEQLAALGRLSAQVAHEIRNPLHSIGLEAELALDEAAKAGQVAVKESLRSILDSVERLEHVTENYLKLSRTNPSPAESFDLGDAMESSLALYSGALQSQRVRMEWTRAEGVSLEVRGDRRLVEQGIGNLLRNAIQAVEVKPEAERKIRIELGRDERGAFLRIEDSGAGVAAEHREAIFNPFFTTKAHGTGLGLSFVRQVVERQGGGLALLAPAELGGAHFEMRVNGDGTHSPG